MYALDFSYAEHYLSDFGFIVCDFNGSSGAKVANPGCQITFNKVSRHGGRRYSLASTRYTECIQTTFDICKDPEIYIDDDKEITSDEFRDLMRWLNRHEFHEFYVFEERDPNKESCYFNASFNVSKIFVGEVLVGLRLSMETDSPYAHGEEREFTFDYVDGTEVNTLMDVSDEIGSIYPDVIITCNADGDLTVANEFTDCVIQIKGVTAGEVITLHGDTQIIETSLDSHDIADDFNYEFLRIGNTYEENLNKITANLPCNIVIKYRPIIKETP